MNRLDWMTLILFLASWQNPVQSENLRINYELSLTRCIQHSCRSEIGKRAEVLVSLGEESGFLTGYTPVELQLGKLAYQVRFNLRDVHEKSKLKLDLTLGFSGRIGTLTGKQVTWGEKSFSANDWNAFKNATVTGTKYSENGESITPTLTVREISLDQ